MSDNDVIKQEDNISQSSIEAADIFLARKIYPDAASIFQPRPKSLEDIKDTCIVVLDTNVLLVPYIVSTESLEEIRKTYASLVNEGRLVVPGQVAREFAKNRATKLTELYQQLSRKRNATLTPLGSYPLLASVPDYQEAVRIEKKIAELQGELRRAMGKVLDHIARWDWNDPVSTAYAELFAPEVVVEPSITEEQITGDLVFRQSNKIAPGYKDSAKSDQGIGDLLIWHTILEIGESRKQSVLFVSGDEKTDWRIQSENKSLYPRSELVDEFARRSGGKSFHIIKVSELLELFGASTEIIAEVRQEELQQQSLLPDSLDDYHLFRNKAILSVEAWLKRHYPEVRNTMDERLGIFEFAVKDLRGNYIPVDIRTYHMLIGRQFSDVVDESISFMADEAFRHVLLILVCRNKYDALQAANSLSSYSEHPGPVTVVVGTVGRGNNFLVRHMINELASPEVDDIPF